MYLFHKKTKVLRVLALLCAFALGLCMTGGFQMTEAKTTYYDASAGRLHVKGTKLVDKKGHEVQLRGVSTHGLSWYPQYVNDKCFAQLHDKWGANVVRLAMYTEEYNGYCSGDAKNRSDLKKLIKKGVKLAKKHKMYVIVDWHILSDGNPNSHKKEAKALAMNSGAVEDSIEIYVEIDDQTQKVTAIAMGSTEVKTTDLMKNCTAEEAIAIAAESVGAEKNEITLAASNGFVFVLTMPKDGRTPIYVVDKKGFIKVQRANGNVERTTLENAAETLKKMWDQASNFSSEVRINPDVYVISESRVLDYSGIPELTQVTGLIEAELADQNPEDEIILVLARNEL